MPETRNENHHRGKSLEQLPQGTTIKVVLTTEEVKYVWPKAEDRGPRTFNCQISGREAVLQTGNEEYDRKFRISFKIKDGNLYYGENPIGTVENEQE